MDGDTLSLDTWDECIGTRSCFHHYPTLPLTLAAWLALVVGAVPVPPVLVMAWVQVEVVLWLLLSAWPSEKVEKVKRLSDQFLSKV